MDTILLILRELVLITLTVGMVILKSNLALPRVVKLAIDAIPPFTVFDHDVDGICDITGFDLARDPLVL